MGRGREGWPQAKAEKARWTAEGGAVVRSARREGWAMDRLASLLVAAAIVMADGFPVLYRHNRVGRDGRVFGCLKFRSMVRDSEQRLADHRQAEERRRLV